MAGHRRHLRFYERLEQRLDPVRWRDDIIVRCNDDLPARMQDPGVARVRQAGTTFVDDDDPRELLRDPACRSRGRPIVHDDDLEPVPRLLRHERHQAAPEIILAITARKHDGDQGRRQPGLLAVRPPSRSKVLFEQREAESEGEDVPQPLDRDGRRTVGPDVSGPEQPPAVAREDTNAGVSLDPGDCLQAAARSTKRTPIGQSRLVMAAPLRSPDFLCAVRTPPESVPRAGRPDDTAQT